MRKVIVTGGTGFIGRNLVKRLSKCKQFSVTLVANASNLSGMELSENNPLTYFAADIRDKEAILKIFRDEKADICIHLAAKTSVADSIKKPRETMDINVKGTLNVLEACESGGINSLVFASSAAVYGDVKELPISEDESLRPLSPYGTSKMLAENHVSTYGRLKKIQKTISLRIFNAYGPGQTSENDVITKFAKRLSNGLPPIIYGNGNFTRDFISVDDITEAILLSLRAMELPDNNLNYRLLYPAVLNVGTGIPTSIVELAHKMIDIFGLKLNPKYEQGNNSEGVILHSYANMLKAKRTLNFTAKTNLEIGLRNMIERMQLSNAS